MADEKIIPYSSTTLLEVQRLVKDPFAFFLNFFQRQINFETDTISFEDVVIDNRRMAPFVAPNVQAGLNRLEGYNASQYKPAYIKEKDVVDINMPLFRQVGETPFTGSLSLNQRRNAVIAYMTEQQVQRIKNRWEWMAAQAIMFGSITIQSERYPKCVLDFGRDAGLTLTTNWKAAGANGFNDIKRMRQLSNRLAGTRITKNFFGADAWDAFCELHKDQLKDLMDTRYRGSETNFSKLLDGYDGIEYVGVIKGLNGAGSMEVYVNTATYLDDDGNTQYVQDQGSVFGIEENAVNGVRCFGAIRDGRANYQAMPIFPKNWVGTEDPFDEFIMHQSAPLMVPMVPNATYYIKAV